MQDYAASEKVLREAMEILGEYYGHASEQYAACLTDLARLCIFQDKFSEAEFYIAESLELVFGLPLIEQRAYLAACINLSKLQRLQKDFDAAEKSLETAREKAYQVVGENHRMYASLLHHLGEVYWNQNRISDAERTIRDSLRIYNKMSHTESADYAMAMSLLGILFDIQGKREQAWTCQTEAFNVLNRIRPENHPNVETVKLRISALNEAGGR
mgnify:CR=1 FL=1